MVENMRVLVVDDEKDIRESLQEILEDEGYDVLCAETIEEAKELLISGIDLSLLDIKLGAQNGLDLLKYFKLNRPQMPVIMISGHGTVALTAQAFKLGAHEFMEKPLRLVQVRACVRNALESVRLKKRVSEQARNMHPKALYKSEVMKTLFGQTVRLSNIQEPVVIMGPSGSGKELIARALHYEGIRAGGPFVATNAASMPLTLAEDELFGHEKGAFTGAHAKRIGCIEKADGGTLFLDEIADMDVQIQAKLLRVLENGEYCRLGSTKSLTANVRIVAATHKDLEQMASDGSFRHDLWYRLCAFVLRVPPLEERQEDIILIARAFLKNVCTEMSLTKQFSQSALEHLQRRHYPGNIRELKHLITRTAVLSDGDVIDTDSINLVSDGKGGKVQDRESRNTFPAYTDMDFRTARTEFEKDYLTAVLQKNEGNVTTSAAQIGMAQSNLSRKLKELGLR